MTNKIEPTPASSISKLRDVGEMIERSLVSKDELTREVGAIALEATQALCEALEKVPHWISVKKRLPEYAMNVMVRTVAYVGGKHSWRSTRISLYVPVKKAWQDVPPGQEVTHWMYMPEPPKEDVRE